MPFESGGLADKLGNRYEGRWVAVQLLYLLEEKIQSVTIEAIGDDEQGVDLWIVQKHGVRQAQQCKARNASKEYWPISDLIARGVLSKIQFQLDRDTNHEFAFVSSIGSEIFKDICGYARRSGNIAGAFYQEKILKAGKEVQACFRQFCSFFSLEPRKEEDLNRAFDYLTRIYIYVYPDDQATWQTLLDRTGYLLIGDPEIIITAILTYAENKDRFGSPIYADELRNYLSEHDIHPKRLEHDDRIAPAIQELQVQFTDSIRPLLIDGTPLQRSETSSLIEAFEDGKNIILSGAAGYGKSGVLFELTLHLQKENIPYLPVRLDRRAPKDTAAHFGQQLGLPDSPAFSLSALAGERKSVLILDQLDAIRWTSAHANNALDVCKELVRHVQSLRRAGKKIAVVLSSRTFDLEHDPSIRIWLADTTDKEFVRIEVTGLSTDILQRLVGSSFPEMTEKERSLLACPQNLAIWMELKRTGPVPSFQTSTDLIREFWKNRRLKLEEQADITTDQMSQVLSPLLDHMEQNGKISAPSRIIASWPRIKEALFSYGVLQESAGMISFCHQSYLDYLIAERLLRQMDAGTGSILGWLGTKENQSLFRREQLRQVLVMLAEESQRRFLLSVKQLLETEEVRFHIKHLALEVIGSQEEITEELGDYCLTLYRDDFWQEHVFETIFIGHSSYVLFLNRKGLISEWLQSQDNDKINRTLWLLRAVSEKIPDQVTEVLEPYLEIGGEWLDRILNTLSWRIADDSERMFQLRLKLARRGITAGFVEWKPLCSKYPLRAIELIEAVISTWNIDDNSSIYRKDRLERWYNEDAKALNKVVEKYPVEIWDLLIPHVERLTCFEAEPYDRRLEKWRKDRIFGRQETDIARGVVELTMLAGRCLASDNPDMLIDRTGPLENSASPIIREILIVVYKALPLSHADSGIKWLLADVPRFRLDQGYDKSEWQPAERLIKSLSPHCSEELFRQLEDAIVHYHSPDEKRLAEYYLGKWRDGNFGHYWGEAQYFLLPTLAAERVRSDTTSLLKVLQRKFSSYPEGYFIRGRISGGMVGSKLEPSLDKISDRSWLAIITNRKVSKEGNHKWIQVNAGHVLEASIWQFSRSLETMAKRYPERFGRLALQFPDDVDLSYISAILSGCAEKAPDSNMSEEDKNSWRPASIETVEAILEKFQAGDDRETAISFCRLISQRAEENWADATLARLIYYARNHPDLEAGKLNVCCDKTADEASIDVLYQNMINCVRGVAAEAIGRLLWEHCDWLEKLRLGIESLVQDKHPVVRMAAIETLLPVINIDKDQAVKWFVTACNSDLRVAASPRAQLFYNYTVPSHIVQIGPIIQQMVRSTWDDVAKEGATQVTARWLFHGYFEEELLLCQTGLVPQRQGIAEVASHLLHDRKYSEGCQKLLRPLLNDPDKEVRQELRGLLDKAESLSDTALKPFIIEYIASLTFVDSPERFVYFLKDVTGSILYLAETIFTMCSVFSSTLKERSREIGSSYPHAVSEMLSILLRLYEQALATENMEIAAHCLDIWDILFQNRVGIVRDLSKAIEQ
jgi:hypothetical protein